MIELALLVAQTAQQQDPSGIPGWVYAAVSAAVSALVTILSGKVVVPTFSYQRESTKVDRLEAQLANDYVPKAQYEQEKARADRMEGEVRDMNAAIRGDVMNALIRNTELVERQSEELVRLKAKR